MASYDLGSAYGKVIIDTANVNRAATAFSQFSTVMLGIGVAAGAAFGAAVNAAATFERSIDTFGAVSGATGEEMEKVRQKVLDLGRDSIFSANQVAQAVADMSKAGITTEDIMSGAAEAVVNLAAATDTDLAVASEVATGAMNTFNLTGKDMAGVVDSIAKAVNASSINTQDLAYSLKYAGAPAHQLGLSIEETTAAIGLLGKAGITGSTAGTSLRRILLNLSPASKEAEAEMRKLGIITAEGTNQFYNAAGGAKSMEEIFGVLNTATKDLSASQKLQALNTIFGNRAVGSATLFANAGAEGFRAYTDELNKLPGSAEIAGKRLDNLSGDFEILKGNIDSMLVDAGSPFQQMLRDWVQDLTKLVQAFNELDPATQKAIFQTLGYTAALAGGLGLFTAIISGILRMISAFKAVGAALTVFGRITGISKVAGKAIYELQFLLLRLSTAVQGAGGVWAVLGRAMSFLLKPIGLIVRGIGLLVGIIGGSTIGIVVAVVLALGAAFYAAYRYIEPFHKAVDAAWQGIQKAWDVFLNFIRDIPGAFVNGFNEAKDAVSNFVSSVVTFFQELPGKIATFLTELPGKAREAFSNFVNAAVEFLAELPNKIAYWLGFALGRITRWIIDGATAAAQFGVEFVGKIVNFLIELPAKIAYWLSFALGYVTGWIIEMGGKAIEFGTTFVTNAIQFLQELPGKIWEFLVAAYNFATTWRDQMVEKAIQLGTDFLNSLVSFFTQLPGRIWDFLVAAYNFAVTFGSNMINKAIEIGREFVNGAIRFIRDLPGNIAQFLTDAFNKAVEFGTKFIQKAKDIAKDFVEGFVEGIKGIPGKLDEVIESLIRAINGAKDRLKEAITNVGKNLVQGFLDGLDKHSPSAIERAMFEVVDGVGASMADLQDHVKTVHGLANSFGSFGGDYSATLTAAGVGGSNGDVNVNMEFNGVSSEDIPAIRSAMTSSNVLTKLTQAARAGRRG